MWDEFTLKDKIIINQLKNYIFSSIKNALPSYKDMLSMTYRSCLNSNGEILIGLKGSVISYCSFHTHTHTHYAQWIPTSVQKGCTYKTSVTFDVTPNSFTCVISLLLHRDTHPADCKAKLTTVKYMCSDAFCNLAVLSAFCSVRHQSSHVFQSGVGCGNSPQPVPPTGRHNAMTRNLLANECGCVWAFSWPGEEWVDICG